MQNEGVKKGMAQSNFVRWANWAREMWQRDAGRKLSFDAAHCELWQIRHIQYVLHRKAGHKRQSNIHY
jgi:hypothetical protein